MKRDCEIIRELAFEAHRTGASPEDKIAIRDHLTSCASCRLELRWIEEVTGAIDFRGATLDPAREARLHDAMGPIFEQAAELQRKRQRRFAWPFVLPLATAAAALIALGIWWRVDAPAPKSAPELERPLAAKVTLRSGQVEVEGRLVGEQVAPGQTVVARAASLAALQLAEDHVQLLAQSEVKIDASTKRAAALRLRRGTVHVHVKKGAGRRFSVRAPFGLVEVTGTRFAVSAAEGGRVTTLAGSVRVTLTGRAPLEVRAGQTLNVNEGRVSAASGAMLAPLRRSFELPVAPLAEAAMLLVVGKPAGAVVQLDGREVGRAPLWLRRRPGRVAYVITAGKRRKSGFVSLQAGRSADVRYDLAPSSRPTPRVRSKQPTSPAGRARLAGLVRAKDCAAARRLAEGAAFASPHARAEALALTAECYQAQRQSARARALYQRIVRRFGRTPTAANALFELGRLAAKEKRSADARVAFRRYLAKHRNHPLASDAKFRLCRLDIEAKRYAQAVRCLRSYRKRFARGPQRAETIYLEARMRKDALNDCRGALKLYQRYLASGAQLKRGEAARFGRLDCLRRLSDARFAAEARAYLGRYPKHSHAATVRRWISN